ncbi:MAG: uncharacterized protein A8A55_3509, partial [Amphiamblys sp. WSBS2006]
SIWIGKVKRLKLEGYALGTLPKLKFHEENVMEELKLDADKPEHITEILKEENKNILGWVGKAKNLILNKYAVEALPKLKLHEENEMEFLELRAEYPGEISEILKMDNNSLLIGRVKRLELRWQAVRILPKLKLHEENAVEELALFAGEAEISEILKIENSSIWIGKVKRLKLEGYALGTLPKLKFHEEN